MSLLYAPFRLDVSRFGLDKYFGDAYGSSSGNQMVFQLTLNFISDARIALDSAVAATTFDGRFTARLYCETQTSASCENGIYKNIA